MYSPDELANLAADASADYAQYNDDRATNEAKLEASIESKMVVMREGSSLRTAEEMCEILIDDAHDLCGFDLSWYKLIPHNEDYYQILSEYADEAESALFAAGYSVFHNDGYVIYQDLTEEESDYLGGF